MKKVAIATALMMASASACAATADDIVTDKGNGRYDFGWTGTGGGNLEAYSKNATGAYDSRDGQFKFIFGGAPGTGTVTFTHYNGSGWSDRVVITPEGNLSVKGKIKANEIEVVDTSTSWPDYVFKDGYNLMSIDELNRHIEEKGHLPGIPTAEEISKNGQNLGLMSAKTLEKVEELALYVIQLKKDNDSLRTEIEQMRNRLDQKP
ncbi:bZIP transcription factor [Thiocystis violacea]|uniref:bZIP transcription factor n=1 Tax=Thiocystis violacea TaxID=13725 RepID=UPI00190312E7|nr:bZIP transcription factor [Thiocystis violacea]MBK1722285.1 hypothetical protein [Thiocystis violacea]